MSVGFGFSVSDFVAAVQLVGTVVDALSANSTDSCELHELYQQLRDLETTLRNIDQLDIDNSLHAEVIALKQSAAQCQSTIHDFLRKTEPYQAHLLLPNGGQSSLQSKWKKVKWALCKKKHVVQFRTNLLIHTQSIQLTLNMILIKHVALGQKHQQVANNALALQVQHAFGSCMSTVQNMSSTLTNISVLARRCTEDCRRIVRIHFHVFRYILDVQRLLANLIPAQVPRQQPVYLIDAFGRYSPFYLETIRSPAALVYVLSDNASWFGSASRKILKGEFAIQDVRTKRDIRLVYPLDHCLAPGQQVEMSMIFTKSKIHLKRYRIRLCPRCHSKLENYFDEERKCGNCDLTFRRRGNPMYVPSITASELEKTAQFVSSHLSPKQSTRDDEDMSNYHRIRLWFKSNDLWNCGWCEGGPMRMDISIFCDYCIFCHRCRDVYATISRSSEPQPRF